jgi:hypothetical protein
MHRVKRILVGACAAMLLFGLSGWAGAEERPLARVVLMPELIPSVVGQLVPITVDLPAGRLGPRASKVKISGLVYCGGDGKGGAWAVGAADPRAGAAGSNVLSTARALSWQSGLGRDYQGACHLDALDAALRGRRRGGRKQQWKPRALAERAWPLQKFSDLERASVAAAGGGEPV